MYELIISGEKANLKILVFRFENPSATDKSDASWLVCQVNLSLPYFTANYDASFTANDFLCFRRDIEKALTCVSDEPEAIFQTDEEMLYIKLKFSRTGKIYVSGIAEVRELPGASLSFSYETDLFSIESLLKQLQKLETEKLRNF
ncbi:MAG TPA: hypothetical protein DEA62_05150 [Coxiellaceae bacterium]|nr:hypothetical protein [Coxiellaceae bacterium]